MRTKDSKGLRGMSGWSIIAAVCLCALSLTGCGDSMVYNDEVAEVSGMSDDTAFSTYSETTEAAEAADDAAELAEEEADTKDAQGEDGTSVPEEQNKILVYEGAVSIDAMEFEVAVRAFKSAVEEYGGFLEDEQSYGSGFRYDDDSSYSVSEPRTFMATARIPSETYRDFMEKAEGIGRVTESNSRVTNMTRQYGTLKAELEIYEAEYERYLKMFDEVSDDNAMIAIQEKLTELSLNIARTKSEMAVIDTDAAYSTVEVRIHEVAAYKENGAGFFERLKSVLAKSWEGMLGFFEGILFFFILHWYKLLLLFLVIFLIVKFVKKYEAKNKRKRQQALQAYQAGHPMQGMQGQTVKKEEVKGAVKTAGIPREEAEKEQSQHEVKEEQIKEEECSHHE